MSYKAFNGKKNKAKKGISPVIATVILVAVAVVIAAALAGFSSSLFGTYSSAGGAVTVQSISVNENGDAEVSFHNSGNTSDSMLSISVVPFGPGTIAEVLPIPPGESVDYEVSDLGEFQAGQVITVRMGFQSGAQLTQSVIVTQA